MSEWISVKEGLPEKDGYYIVSAYDGHINRVSFVKWQKLGQWALNGNRGKCA